jgi:MYXO-CTERM domain-containing protein
VRLQVVDGTASAGDRLVSAQVLTWADGDASPKTVTVEAPDDALLEGEETFSIRLVDPRGVQTTQRALTVTIEDDEALRSLVVAAAEPRITAGGNVAFVVRPSRAVLGPISVVGYVSDGFDANGWPNASGINSSGAIRTLLRWPAGSTAEQRMSMGTNRTYVKPEYSMHARLSWVAGLVRNDAGPIGASLVVAPPPPATPPTSSGGPSPAPAGSASSGGGSGGGGTFGFAGVIGLAGLALLRHRRR